MTKQHPILKAVEIVGSKSKLASELSVSPANITQWLTGGRPVPPRRAVEIERLTGGKVKRGELCPDFPWDHSPAA